MTPRTVRRAERIVHLFWGLVIALYVYGLLPSWGEPVLRWFVVPGIVGSGFAMWFAAPLRRLIQEPREPLDGPRRRRGGQTARSASVGDIRARRMAGVVSPTDSTCSAKVNPPRP
jgi:hypothetical protein